MPMSRKNAKTVKKMHHAEHPHGHEHAGVREMHHLHAAKKPHHAGHAPMRKMSVAVKRGK